MTKKYPTKSPTRRTPAHCRSNFRDQTEPIIFDLRRPDDDEDNSGQSDSPRTVAGLIWFCLALVCGILVCNPAIWSLLHEWLAGKFKP